MTSILTREKVIRETDQLVQRSSQLGGRLRSMETDHNFRHLSFVEVRDALDETEKELRLARQLTCSNEIDFRQVELILTEERQSLAAISEILDRAQSSHHA